MKVYIRKNKKMFMFKKISILFLSILLSSIVIYAPEIEEEKKQIYVDVGGWCPNIPVEISLYDPEEWEIREEIIKDRDINLTSFKDTKVFIHSGPFESMPEIYSGTIQNISFQFTFTSENNYLLRIEPDNQEYENLNKIIEIIPCRHPSTQRQNENKEFTYSEEKIKLEFEETKYLKEEISIKKLEQTQLQKDINLKQNEEIIKIIEIENTRTESFSNLNIKIEEEEKIESVKFFNQNTQQWEEVNFNIQENEIIFETTELGIFALIKNSQETQIQIEEESEEINNQNTQDEITEEQSNQNIIFETNDNQSQEENNNLIIIIGIISIIGIVSFYLFNKNNKNKELYHSDKTQEILTSYNQEYERTKVYVQQYKQSYSGEQIKISLKQANIHDDIIEKVFLEEGVKN